MLIPSLSRGTFKRVRSEASIDLRPGGRWRFVESTTVNGITAFEGEYLDVVANELLVFTWAKVIESQAGRRDVTPPSKVEIRFVPAGGGTNLRIVHSSLDDESRIGFRFGWEAGTTNLVAFLAAESSVPTKSTGAELNGLSDSVYGARHPRDAIPR